MTSALGISDELTTFSRWFTGVLAFIGWPSASCALVGLMQRGNRPEVKYTWLLPLILPIAALACTVSFRQEYFQIVIAAVGVIASRHAYKLGLALSKSWRQLGSQSKLFAPYLWAINTVGIWLALQIVFFFNAPSTPHEQGDVSVGWTTVCELGVISYATGIATALSCRSRRLGTQLGAVLTIQTPTIMILGASIVAGLLNGITAALGGIFDLNVAIVAVCSLPVMLMPSIAGALTVNAAKSLRPQRTK